MPIHPLAKTRRYGVSLPESMAKRAETIARAEGHLTVTDWLRALVRRAVETDKKRRQREKAAK